jgi:hypothetical protein
MTEQLFGPGSVEAIASILGTKLPAAREEGEVAEEEEEVKAVEEADRHTAVSIRLGTAADVLTDVGRAAALKTADSEAFSCFSF